MSRPRLLFTSTLHTPFLDDDLDLLRRHADVDVLITRGPFALARTLPRLFRADVSFTWFASVYACPVVAGMRFRGRPSLIAVGGVDASRLPDIGYGLWNSAWKGVLAGYAIRHATAVLVVDASLRDRLITLARYNGENIRVVPTGFDAAFWTPVQMRRPCVLTVAACQDEVRWKVKGIPLLLDAAVLMPDVPFDIVGPDPLLVRRLAGNIPPNVTFHPAAPREELRGFYRSAAVYCQPSRSEGLPNSVCEAMLCGCVPVGTDVGGMRSAIGDTGFLVGQADPRKLADALRAALKTDEEAGIRARARVAAEFTVERREQELVRLLREVVR